MNKNSASIFAIIRSLFGGMIFNDPRKKKLMKMSVVEEGLTRHLTVQELIHENSNDRTI